MAQLAGVVLATSEYRHELESDIDPFKGLLLGLFFVTVGTSVDVAVVMAHAGWIAAAVVGLIAVKKLTGFKPLELTGVPLPRIQDPVLDDRRRRPAVVVEEPVEVGDVGDRDVGPRANESLPRH